MKQFVLFTTLALLPFSLAGELGGLHEILARSTVVLECASAPVSTEDETAKTEGVRRVTRPECTPPTSEPEVLEIGIERITCLSGCPAYTFIVGLDGRFRYVGESGVDLIGAYTGFVDLGRVRQVRRFAGELHLFDLPDTFPGLLDNPTTYILVSSGSKTKVIADGGLSSPASLWALAQLIDGLLNLAVWD